MNSLRIGICGWGNVATGLYKAINSNSEQIKSAGNTNIDIVVIGARRDNPKCDPKETKIERDIFDVLDHDIDVMVELIGGVEVARELILASICKGIHVVTANKAVLYHHGDEIFTKAKEKNVHVLYESSVCAGTPIIKMLNEELAGNKISKISGMLNGTSNFIHGIPHVGIIIAKINDNEITDGIIFNPILNEFYWSSKGMGAWCNDRRLRVANRNKLSDPSLIHV